MDCKTPQKTPPKFLENLHTDLKEAVNKKNQTQSSPFYCLPNHTTPPNRFIKIRNPFEAGINERLHLHVFSPSVFAETKNPKNTENFKWTIDDVSSLKPANIDESSVAQFESTNSEEDMSVQAKIEKYFSETHIVPSPWNQEQNVAPLLPNEISPNQKSDDVSKTTTSVWTQTVLTLPPKLPDNLEEALMSFFTFTEDQRRQSVDMNSSLCRKLFNFECQEEHESCASSLNGSELSAVGSPHIVNENTKNKRTFDSSDLELSPVEISPIHVSTPKKLNNCQISPISKNEDMKFRCAANEKCEGSISPIALRKRIKNESAKLEFSGHMSVDNSFNTVPENENPDLIASPIQTNDCSESCNWDVEYNNVLFSNNKSIRRNLFEDKKNSAESMDISNLTTPKSRIINEQRKQLSACFKYVESHSDEEILNFTYNENSYKYTQCYQRDKNVMSDVKDDSFNQNTQDTGYGTELSQKTAQTRHEEDMIVSDISDVSDNGGKWNLFASTPSKKYFRDIHK